MKPLEQVRPGCIKLRPLFWIGMLLIRFGIKIVYVVIILPL